MCSNVIQCDPILQRVAKLFPCPRFLIAHLPDLGVTWLLGPPQHSECGALVQLPALGFPRRQPTLAVLGSASDGLCRVYSFVCVSFRAHGAHQHMPQFMVNSPKKSCKLFRVGFQLRSSERSAQHLGFHMLCLARWNISRPHAHTPHKG